MEEGPQTSFDRPIYGGYLFNVTGPAPGTSGQELHLEIASLALNRSLKDSTIWVARKFVTESAFVNVGSQQSSLYERHDAFTIFLIFSIHEDLRFYLNLMYCRNRSEETLDSILAFIQRVNQNLLDLIPESVTLFRCVIPISGLLDQENNVVLEQIVVEFFWFPLTEQWSYRVRSAVIDNSRPWFMSTAVAPEDPDVIFPDNYEPEGHTPEGHIPDGHVPEGPIPDGLVPDGYVPDGHAPDDLVHGDVATNEHDTMSTSGIVDPLTIIHTSCTVPINDIQVQPVQVLSVQIQPPSTPALADSTSSTVLPMCTSCTHPNPMHEHCSDCSITTTHGVGSSLSDTAHETDGGSTDSNSSSLHPIQNIRKEFSAPSLTAKSRSPRRVTWKLTG
ncbi:hypothetical protein BGZ95_009523 [Linnemannia exigua]|uniref:Uncharacterized protein n=1 Tax=Linnemannia exigua TaxID=604196 RepID=A0AAD4DCU3_9FUNG|nr:hypothetical protein BGZ95_009523 [Linnemannia exigua]